MPKTFYEFLDGRKVLRASLRSRRHQERGNAPNSVVERLTPKSRRTVEQGAGVRICRTRRTGTPIRIVAFRLGNHLQRLQSNLVGQLHVRFNLAAIQALPVSKASPRRSWGDPRSRSLPFTVSSLPKLVCGAMSARLAVVILALPGAPLGSVRLAAGRANRESVGPQ